MDTVLTGWTSVILIVAQVGLLLSVTMMPIGAVVLALGAHYAGLELPPEGPDPWRTPRMLAGAFLVVLGTGVILTGICATGIAILHKLATLCTSCQASPF